MLSSLDLKIIMDLQVDGRKSLSELAKDIGTSVSTVRRKVNALIDDGTITIAAIPNPMKVGYLTSVMIGYSIDRRLLEKTADEICKYECNHLVAFTTGRYDLMSWSLFKNNQDLSHYLSNEVTEIRGILSTETVLILDYKKRTFGRIYD
jgi:Lrp/AsnC family transcriptional regulator for asnA, asnC and gidA